MEQKAENRITRPRSSLAKGILVHREGWAFLSQHRALWGLAAVPFALSLLAFCCVAGLVASYGGEIHTWASAWLPSIEVHAWYSWLWLGPLKFLIWSVGGVIFLGVIALCFFLGFLLANIFASPFLDVLSERVERLYTGGTASESPRGLWQNLREIGRVMVEEIRRVLGFLLVQLGILIIGLVPGGQVVAVPAAFLVAALFLTLDMSSYSLDRRRLSFAAKRQWLSQHRFAALGYGVVAVIACAIPGLNWFAMPWFVTSGTLLVLRYPPDSESRAKIS